MVALPLRPFCPSPFTLFDCRLPPGRGYNSLVLEPDRLHEIVASFLGCRVLLYGDLVLDRFIVGEPKRISREAPVIILRHREQRDVPGGAANAIANVAALGGVALPIGAVGDDEPGRTLLGLLAGRGIDTSAVVTVPGYSTPTKVRLLAGGPGSQHAQVARYDIEDFLPDHQGWRRELWPRLAELAPTVTAAAISDYGYGLVSGEVVGRLRASLPAGAPAVADSRFALSELIGVDGATPNLEELAEIAGRSVVTDVEVAEAAEELRARLEATFVLATRGSQGMTLVGRGLEPLHLPVFGSDQVSDVTGAGDTVIATLALALAAGAGPAEAATLANFAGGIVVMKMGTAVVTPDELHRAIDADASDA